MIFIYIYLFMDNCITSLQKGQYYLIFITLGRYQEMDNNVTFHKIGPERWKTEELKNLTTLPESYKQCLDVFIICDKFVHR